MKSWNFYVEEAKKTLNYQKSREEVRSFVRMLQEKGFIEIVKEWETENFPFLQVAVKFPWDNQTYWSVIKSYDVVYPCALKDVEIFINRTKTTDVVMNAFLLFAQDNIDKLFIFEEDLFKKLCLSLGKIENRDVYLVIGEKWKSSDSEEENSIKEV